MATFEIRYSSDIDPSRDLGIKEDVGFEVYSPRSFNSGRVFNNWTNARTEVEIPDTRWNRRSPIRFTVLLGQKTITAQALVLRPTSIDLTILKERYLEMGVFKVLGQLTHAEPRNMNAYRVKPQTYYCELSCPGSGKEKVGQGICIKCEAPKIEFELCC